MRNDVERLHDICEGILQIEIPELKVAIEAVLKELGGIE